MAAGFSFSWEAMSKPATSPAAPNSAWSSMSSLADSSKQPSLVTEPVAIAFDQCSGSGSRDPRLCTPLDKGRKWVLDYYNFRNLKTGTSMGF